MRRLVVWGAGELGGRVAAEWVRRGGAAVGVTRSEARHAELRAAGVEAHAGSAVDVLRPDDALFLALPGSAAQREAVEALPFAPARAVYSGTTGYYGTWSGPVDEDTPPGDDEHARNAAAAEAAFRAATGGGVVLRFGGLYRKGRGPMGALARTRKVPPGPPDKVLALVHYDDAASAAAAALAHPSPEPAYLVVTPPLPTRREFYTAATVILQLDAPLFGPPLGRPPALPDVRRLRRDLLPEPAWPKWQAALVPP
jgi:nucleoside-diphosphate-sugar epimerase